MELNKRQKEIISKRASQFKIFLSTDKGLKGNRDREERKNFFKKLLQKENVSHLSEDDFGKLIRKLWASDVWGRKEYYVNKLLSDNGLSKLKSELEELLYGSHSAR